MALTKITNSAIADDIGLGGNPTTSTQTAGDSTTRIATTAFVSTAVANLVDSAPDTLNTLAELATSIGNSTTLSSTLTTSIATKLPLAGGTMTGNLNLGDNVRARFGTGNDLQLWHNGTFSILDGGDFLRLRATNDVKIQNYNSTASMAIFTPGGSAELRFDNDAKLATTNTGIDVTGNVESTGFISVEGTSGNTGAGTDRWIGGDSTAGTWFYNVPTGSNHYFAVNNSNKLAINSTGIAVTGNIGVTGTVDGIDIATRDAVLTSTTTTAGAALPKAGGTMTGGLSIRGFNGPVLKLGSSGTSDPRIDFEDQNSTNLGAGIFLDQDADTLRILRTVSGSATDGIAINASGNVGIGTASPQAALHVASSSAKIAEFERIGSQVFDLTISDVGEGVGQLWFNAQTNDTGFNFRPKNSSGTSTNALYIDPTGQVGIGTTSPAFTLHVLDTIGGRTLNLGHGVSTGTITTDAAKDLNFQQAGSTKMTLDSSGNVGIGTPTPGAKLHILQTAETFNDGIKIVGSSGPISGRIYMNGEHLHIDNATAGANSGLTLDDNGNVGIGVATPAWNLQVAGRAHIDYAGEGIALHVARNASTAVTNAATVVSNAAVYINGNESGGSDALRIGSMNNSTGAYYIDVSNYNATAAYNLVLQPYLGNVGIGTTTPNDILDIRKANSQLRLTDSDDDKFVQFSYSGGKLITRNNSTNTTIAQVTLIENGNFGIGTISPGSKLEVYNSTVTGNTQLHIHNDKSGDAAVLRLEGKRTSYNDTGQLLFANNGNVVARIDAASAGDDGALRLFTSASGTGNSIVESMSISQSGNVDLPRTGSRMSAYVQDSFHIGSEKSANGRYALSSTRTYVDGGSSNYQGYVFSNENWFPQCFIPYSPHQVYRISASIHQLTGSTASGGANARHYLGLAGYDENFNFLSVDAIGTYQYVLASNTTVSTGNTLEVDITMKGWNAAGAADGKKMDQGTVYIRPLWLANYQTAGGTAVLTGFNIQPAATVADNDSNAGTNY